MVTLTPKRGAQVASPTVEEAREIFRTRALLEVANLPDVIARCQPPHLAALEAIKLLSGMVTPRNTLRLFDARSSGWRHLALHRASRCPVCGGRDAHSV